MSRYQMLCVVLVLLMSGFTHSLINRCYMYKDSGPCYGYMRRYYYNMGTRRCELFIYGGCRGNSNNFRTFYECQRACGLQY